MMIAHAAQAGGPFALDGPAGAGGGSFATTGQPGLRLSHSLRLRIDGVRDNLADITRGISPLRSQAIDRTHRRAFNSMIDFFPSRDSGFHLTAGMRRSPKRARWSPGGAGAETIFMPRLDSPLRVRTNVARSSPVAMIGWSGALAEEVSFSLSAGAMQEHGRSTRMSPSMIARQQATSAGWSRIGGVAQMALSIGF